MVTFYVRDKGIATVTPDTKVQLRLYPEDIEAALADHPTAEELERMGTSIGVRIPLADLNGQALNFLVKRAWLHRAPKRLAGAMEAAEAARPGEVGDLPASLGGPATRALAGAGITSLADVAARSEQDLLALHGVGPRAIRMLSEELAARGMVFRSDPSTSCRPLASNVAHHGIAAHRPRPIAGRRPPGGQLADLGSGLRLAPHRR